MSEDEKLKLERRSFLEQCGRFAVATPPVVSLMLASSTGAKALTTSGGGVTTTTPVTVTSTVTQLKEMNTEEAPSELALKIDSLGVMKHT